MCNNNIYRLIHFTQSELTTYKLVLRDRKTKAHSFSYMIGYTKIERRRKRFGGF